jgi:hypothetical protein
MRMSPLALASELRDHLAPAYDLAGECLDRSLDSLLADRHERHPIAYLHASQVPRRNPFLLEQPLKVGRPYPLASPHVHEELHEIARDRR